MNKLATATLLAVLAGSSAAFALEPIPGSITYGGNQAYLDKSPVGSTVFNTFFTGNGEAREVYRVGADHSLSLVSRVVVDK